MTIYEKVVSVFSALMNIMSRKMARGDVANEYDPNSSSPYEPGDLVVYNNVLYMCINRHASAEWSNDDFTPATVDQALRYAVDQKVSQAITEESVATKNELAMDFDKDMEYAVGSLVMHNGILYRCTTEHKGPWGEGDDFTTSNVNSAIQASVDNMGVSLDTDLRKDLVPKTDIAPEAYSGGSYLRGQLVYKNGTLYRCNTDGEWVDGNFDETTINDSLGLKADKSGMSITEVDGYADRRLVTLKPGNGGSQAFLISHQDISGLADDATVRTSVAKKPSYQNLNYEIVSPVSWSIVSEDDTEPLEYESVVFDYASGEFYVFGSNGVTMASGIEPDDEYHDSFSFEYQNKTWMASTVPSQILIDRAINSITKGRYSTTQPWMVPDRTDGLSRHFFVHLDPTGTSPSVTSLDIRLSSGDQGFYGVSGDALCINPEVENLIEFIEISPGHILVKNCMQVYDLGVSEGGTIQIGMCQESS